MSVHNAGGSLSVVTGPALLRVVVSGTLSLLSSAMPNVSWTVCRWVLDGVGGGVWTGLMFVGLVVCVSDLIGLWESLVRVLLRRRLWLCRRRLVLCRGCLLG